MTKKFTAEEVRRAVVQMRVVNLGELHVEQMLIAYADTLSKPADSGRVSDEMVERARAAYFDTATVEDGVYTDPIAMRAAITAALAAQGQGEPVAWLEAEPSATLESLQGEHSMLVHSMQFHIGKQRPSMRPPRNKLFPLYTRPNPPASPAGVPDAAVALLDALQHNSWDLRCFDHTDGEDIGWRVIEHYQAEPRERVIAEVFEDNPRYAIKQALLANAPSAPEGGHIDRARFEKAPCYLCGYNGPGYYQPGTHSCAAKYHATQPKGE